MATRFSQFMLAKVKKIFKKSQPHSRSNLRKLRLGQKSGFLIKQTQ